MVVKRGALVKERRLRRIEIFRRALRRRIEHATAESDDAAAPISDREDHAVAKQIVGLAVALAFADQAGFEEKRLGKALLEQRRFQRRARLGREADAEALDDGDAHAALGEIVAPRPTARAHQFQHEPFGRSFDHGMQRLALLAVFALFARHVGNLQAGLAGELFDRLGERGVLGTHDEADDVAVRAAAEAMEEALVLADGEGRALFVVERAKPRVFAAAFDQLDAARHHIGDVQPIAQLIEKGWIERHQRLSHSSV